MTTYASYMPHTHANYCHTPHYHASSPNRHDQKTQRSPFPREGTPTPTIRGKPRLSSQPHRQQAGFAKSHGACPQSSQTHDWVLEQEYLRREKAKQSKKTERWVFEQRTLFPGETLRNKDDFPPAWEERTRNQMYEDLLYEHKLEVDRWARQQEELRRLATEREKTKVRYVQEELKRLEARMRAKRESERQKMVEEKLRAQMEARERDRKERANVQKTIADAWSRYENGWETVANSTAPIAFGDIPWPMKIVPTKPEDITPNAIVTLLLSPFHSPKQTRKDRLRSAQLRWHPDRFRRVLNRVKEEDKEAVEQGVGTIARCLNDLMSREKAPSRLS